MKEIWEWNILPSIVIEVKWAASLQDYWLFNYSRDYKEQRLPRLLLHM